MGTEGVGDVECGCDAGHARARVVLTGGPGAGKTAVLELIRKSFCKHVRVLPEAAGIVFGGGFPRTSLVASRRAAQRAIFYVQRELEAESESSDASIVLCDRGTVDGIAYWPGPDDLLSSVDTNLAEQLARYEAVIHLRTPALALGYNRTNPLRTESAAEAISIDDRIAAAWADHPRRFVVEPTTEFLTKARAALSIVRSLVPPCCRAHRVAGVDDDGVELAVSAPLERCP